MLRTKSKANQIRMKRYFNATAALRGKIDNGTGGRNLEVRIEKLEFIRKSVLDSRLRRNDPPSQSAMGGQTIEIATPRYCLATAIRGARNDRSLRGIKISGNRCDSRIK